MEALNQSARSTAINRFIGIYSLSLLLVLLIAYILFKTPVSIFKTNLKEYEASQTEQERLLSQAGALTGNLKNIEQADKDYLNTNNDLTRGDLKKNFQQYEKNISDKLVDIKRDTAQLISPLTKKSSYNYIAAFDAILTYRNSIDFLRNTLEDKKIDVGMIEKTNTQLSVLTRENEMLKIQLAAKGSSTPAPGPGPNTGGGSNNAAMVQLQKELSQCRADMENLKKQPNNDATAVQLQKELSQCRIDLENLKKQRANDVDITEAKKAEVLFNAADELMQIAQASNYVPKKKYMFEAAKQLYEKVRVTYQQPAAVSSKLSQITAELRKLQQ